MRTTLDLDDDVLATAKEIARRNKSTAGRVVSDLARLGLTGSAAARRNAKPTGAHGFEPFASRGQIVTNEAVDRLRDETEY